MREVSYCTKCPMDQITLPLSNIDSALCLSHKVLDFICVEETREHVNYSSYDKTKNNYFYSQISEICNTLHS